MPTISNPKNDRRSLTHAFHEIGADNGVLSQNTLNVNSPIISWTCPRKFDSIRYAGGRHATKFVPRTVQTVTGTAGDDTVVALDNDIRPIAGETDLDDQPFPVVVAYNVDQATEVEVTDINYATNEITLGSDPADTETVKVYPVLSEGEIQFRGLDQFGHEVAPLDEWSTPLHVFSDFEQGKNETEIHLVGAAQWMESETLALYYNGPHQIVWEDADYPGSQYVSTIEQRVDVTV